MNLKKIFIYLIDLLSIKFIKYIIIFIKFYAFIKKKHLIFNIPIKKYQNIIFKIR